MSSRVFLTILDLRAQSRPGFVVRDDERVMVTLHSEATLAECVEVCVDGLTTAELNGVREVYGEPPVPQPLSDFWMDTACRVSWELIPDELLVPSDLWEKQDRRRLMLGA